MLHLKGEQGRGVRYFDLGSRPVWHRSCELPNCSGEIVLYTMLEGRLENGLVFGLTSELDGDGWRLVFYNRSTANEASRRP